jgi:RimK family alpha-L-glutamate ligase
MKKALLVINGYFKNQNNEYKAARLTEEFRPLGIEVEVKDAIELLPLCCGNDISLDLSSYAFALDLDKDNYLAKVLSLKLPLFNSYESMMLSDDKMLSILALYQAGVNAPMTIPAPLCYTPKPNEEQMKKFLDRVEKELGYPLVFKECHGSLGKQVLLVRDRKELEEIEMKYLMTQHFYEKFLAKHQGHDYRIIVIGDEVIACMERKKEHDFRSNIALGGTGRDVTNSLPQSYKDLALKASKALGLLYAGIDVGTDENDEPIFIEANGNAFFTEIEKVSGINIAKKLAEYIAEKVK